MPRDAEYWSSIPLKEAGLWSCPRDAAGETIFVLGAGFSLKAVDPRKLEGRAIVAAKSAVFWAQQVPGARIHCVFYGNDFEKIYEPQLRAFDGCGGVVVTLSAAAQRNLPICRRMYTTREQGLALEPDEICHGLNSGHGALNEAFHRGGPTARYVLLGFDMRRSSIGASHWNGETRANMDEYRTAYVPAFDGIAAEMKAVGCEVLNATPESALEAFPKISFDDLIL